MDFVEIIDILTAGHQNLTPALYFINSFLGAAGALAAKLAGDEKDKIVLPKIENNTIELGIVGSLIVGAVAALLVGYGGWVPIFVGMLAEIIIPAVLNLVKKKVGE